MGGLSDRQERFCQNLVSGMSATEAYVRAGYKTSKAAEVSASKLLRIPKISARIAALRAETAQEAALSRAQVLANFERIHVKAMADGSYAAAVAAMDKYAKMLGYYAPDQVQLSGSLNVPHTINFVKTGDEPPTP